MTDTKLTSVTPEVARIVANAALCRSLMGGTMAMRAAGPKLLPKFEGESQANHQARLGRSFLFNAFGKTVEDMTGRAFAKPIVFGNDVPETLKAYCEDIDRAGRHLNVFARDVFRDGLQTGVNYLLVTAPLLPEELLAASKRRGISRAETDAAGIRSYIVHLTPECMLGWKIETIKGAPTLTQLRFMESVTIPDGEFAEKNIDQVYVIDRTQWRTFRKNEKGEWTEFQSGSNTLGKITLVPFYTNRTGFMTGSPPLANLAEKNVEHWQSSSDQRNILHVARVPILFGTGMSPDDKLELGASSMVRSSNPDAKLSYVEHSGKAIGAGREDLKDIEFQMQAMGLQLLVLDPGQTATGEVRDDVKENSRLAAMVTALQDALEQCLGFMAEYEGLGADKGGSLKLNTDFGITGRLADLQFLTQAALAGKIDDQTYIDELKRRGALADDVDAETVMARAEAVNSRREPSLSTQG